MKSLMLVVIAVLSAACDGSSSSFPSPSAPSAVPTSAASPQPPVAPVPPVPPVSLGPRSLFGYVADTAFRPVAGASVEVMSGPHAGLVTLSNANGGFAFEQDVASPSTVRAVKEGYMIGTGTSILTNDGRAYVGFSLAALSPPVAIAGTYTLTITADSACRDLPDDVRTRSYPATVAAAFTSSGQSTTRFDGRVTSGQFAPFANLFFVGVFGDYVTISTEGEGPSLVERVGENRYVAFYGQSGASVGPDGVSSISTPFSGTIEYCELASPIGQYYDCTGERAAVRHECQSTRHQLTLTRR
jgi:hypothetical protein